MSLNPLLPDSLSDKPFANKICFRSLNFIGNQRNANIFMKYFILVITLAKMAMKPLSVDKDVKNKTKQNKQQQQQKTPVTLKLCWWEFIPWVAIWQKSWNIHMIGSTILFWGVYPKGKNWISIQRYYLKMLITVLFVIAKSLKLWNNWGSLKSVMVHS